MALEYHEVGFGWPKGRYSFQYVHKFNWLSGQPKCMALKVQWISTCYSCLCNKGQLKLTDMQVIGKLQSWKFITCFAISFVGKKIGNHECTGILSVHGRKYWVSEHNKYTKKTIPAYCRNIS